MPADISDIPAPPAPGGDTINMADVAASFMEKNPVHDPVFNPPPEGEAPPAQTRAGQTSPVETPPVSPEPPQKGNRPEAQKRLDQEKAELKRHKEELTARLQELEGKLTGHEELTTKYGELELLAKERQTQLEETTNWYKNEESLLKVNPMDLEPVREAAVATRRTLDAFIPRDISASDESPIPLNADQFIQEQREQIHRAITDWKSIESANNMPSAARGKYQHVILSTLAKAMGVDDRHFSQEAIQTGNGTETSFDLLNPSHPVFQRLKNNIGELISHTDKFTSLRDAAEKAPLETAKQLISRRQSDAIQNVKRSGIGLTGEELKTALSKAPENHNLKVMAVLEEYPELVKELNAEIELEAMVTGHVRRQFDIPEMEPAARSKVGQTLTARFDDRAREIPLVKPLKKALVAKVEELRVEREENARLRKELEAYVSQGEAGGGSVQEGKDAPTQLSAGWAGVDLEKYLRAG